MKLSKLMIVIMACCVGFFSEDAFAIRFPTKVVKRIFEGTEHTAGERWYPEYGATKAGIRNIRKKDSLSRDSLRRNRYEKFVADPHRDLFLRVPASLQQEEYDDGIDSKIDSIQKNVYGATLDSVSPIVDNQTSDSQNNDSVNTSVPPKDTSVNVQQEKNVFSNLSVEEWFAILVAIILLSIAIVKIYKYLPSEKDD